MPRPLFLFTSALLATAATPALGQTSSMAGTRLDVIATGEVSRVPDIARISAGVVTHAVAATDAIRQNAERMSRVLAALKRAGIAERDIQTRNLNLNPTYRYADNQPPVLTGYQASNEVTVRFRDIAATGRILDALVAEGANQINGPSLEIDKPEAALDEARRQALAAAQARAQLYAGALDKRVGRIISISEAGAVPPPAFNEIVVTGVRRGPATKLQPGEQTLSISLSVVFELD